MVKKTNINADIKKKVLNFKTLLEKEGIPVYKIIIFGSYAKNKAKKESDIDVCVVSPKFGSDSVEELQYLLKQRRKIDSRIEPFPVSSDEYKNSFSPIIDEIRKFGKEVRV